MVIKQFKKEKEKTNHLLPPLPPFNVVPPLSRVAPFIYSAHKLTIDKNVQFDSGELMRSVNNVAAVCFD
ncbi:hypothetical protein JOB18_029640 [Solea senegalensis]|uniref:Uncharacterized protein n=1 Tax=Solea senegalensis TaxID=28829 RepID=A0AAV6SI17_SOLSE|nr:hypothetical protein JOB18_029640 [Solea senegalensis]